ncbi:MAG: sigma-70 family RNA polymerase sigma factor [Planctomycetes bacterium]|nr:sigma-70 family RNA polymerase sigma factor [Planctomycetota bacterium]
MEVALSWPYCLAQGSERDLDLVARCQAGCAEAFGVLLNRYRERVLNLAFQLLRDREEAEDVAQEALIKALTGIHKFRGEAQFFTWLYRITVNLCLGRQRRRRDELLKSDPESQAEPPVVTQLMVESVLESLSEPLRVALTLRELHQLTYEEIADVLRIPVGTVRSRLHEARKAFRRKWLDADKKAASTGA